MQSRYSHEPDVRPSVCPSVKCVNCDETKETCAHTVIPHERPIILVFRQEKWLVGQTRFINSNNAFATEARPRTTFVYQLVFYTN